MTRTSGIDRRLALQQMGLAVLAGSLAGRAASGHASDAVKALSGGQLPRDGRLGPLRDLDGYFPFAVPRSAAEWERRAADVRRRIHVAAGLWPAPERLPIEAVVHGKVERQGYSVERVYFQSAPGLYVTGSLYRPAGGSGKSPAILCPHGHWANGRFFDHGEEVVKKEIESGAEKFPVGGRYPLQARCVQLARMGCTVFHYDMLGNADSVPFTQTVIHGLREQRAELKSPERWGLFSAQAELRLINALGLQTFNSLRALDWVSSLPEVDADRIGVTGASGGGTQTFMLVAVDARPAAAFPAVMVSTAMQGGCTCENACYLRIGTGNIEFAALCAPRPLGMTAANDWTKELETKGLPELKHLYAMLGVPDLIQGKYFDFGHNYNYVSRAMMYEFFNKHLELGLDSPIIEEDFVPLTIEELTVWTEAHPKPPVGDDAEVAMVRAWDERSTKQLAALVPSDTSSWQRYRETVGGAVGVMVGRSLPAAEDVEWEALKKTEHEGYRRFVGLLRNKREAEELPAAFLLPGDWNGTVVLWADAAGKQALFGPDDVPLPAVRELIRRGAAVGGIDVLYTGEFLSDGAPLTETRRVENPREIAAYTLGYNHPLFAQRVHDLLTLVAYVRNHPLAPKKIHLVGLGDAAPWVIAAGIQAGASIDKLAVDTAGFRFATVTEIRDPRMWPGAVKYGDIPGLLSLCAPHPLLLAGEGRAAPDVVASCYRAAGAEGKLVVDDGPVDQLPARLVEWLV